jgi:hypothetical protein
MGSSEHVAASDKRRAVMKKFFAFAVMALAFLPGALQAQRIALLDSSINTAEFFERRYGADGACTVGTFLGRNEYERYFRGWKYVLDGQPDNAFIGKPVSTSYDYQILSDSGLTDGSLNSFDVLILSNNASLDDNQNKAIKTWVQKGGKLIATYGSGYKDVITDSRQDDGLKEQKGGTGGLHELWHDPLTKAFGTQAITPDDPTSPGIDILLTKTIGPTAGFGLGVMSYGAEANLLGQRPEHFKNAYAFLNFTPADAWGRSQPAILVTKFSKGNVVYFAFAPEFIVALAFDLAGHCAGDGSYPVGSPALTPGPEAADLPNGFVGATDGVTQINTDRVMPLMQLMKQTLDYMLSLP